MAHQLFPVSRTRTLVIGTIVAFAVLCNAALAQWTEINLNQQPFGGDILDDKGKIIGKISFYGEGTETIYLDEDGDLVVKDKEGNYIAGYIAEAVDPAKSKLTQLFVYNYQDGSEKKSLRLEHQVGKAMYKGGKFTISDPGTTLLTSFKKGEEHLSLQFKRIEHSTDEKDRAVNTLVLGSSDGDEFVLKIKNSRSLVHFISQTKGDVIGYLKRMKASGTR